MKDWTGNKKSTFATLGASSHSEYERSDYDYYATDPKAIRKLLEVHKFADNIWECACGEGHLSKPMIEFGKNVRSTDLVDRGFGVGGIDFLLLNDRWQGDIITNPPYKHAADFVYQGMRLLENGGQLAMFLKLTFLESKSRYKMFQQYPPEYIYVFSERIQVAINGDPAMFAKSSAAAYGWFIWRKGVIKEPVIRWISPTNLTRSKPNE